MDISGLVRSWKIKTIKLVAGSLTPATASITPEPVQEIKPIIKEVEQPKIVEKNKPVEENSTDESTIKKTPVEKNKPVEEEKQNKKTKKAKKASSEV